MNNLSYTDMMIMKDLSSRYKKSTLTKQELSNELGISVSSINNYIVKGCGIPSYVKVGNGKNGKVIFPIINVVDYLSNTVKVS